MRRLLAVAFFASMVGMANAGSPPQGQRYGAGMQSCAQFARLYAANPEITEDLFFSWAQGFISGLNIEALIQNRPFRKLDAVDVASQKIEVRSYCDSHPLVQYGQAVFEAIYMNLPTSPSP
ncbi:MAG: hypothetical protein ACREC1_00870 [Methylovirgula sp.]